ncbi:MAG TPA: hypothetical protein VKF61_09980 [Candidatus Polarisedimenticolia bacterium]|nr:hypothetical protein [Candidatus Polarisedimenticolia bacterium]
MHSAVSKRPLPMPPRARPLAAGLALLMLVAPWSPIPARQEPPAGGGSSEPVPQTTPAAEAAPPAMAPGEDAQAQGSAGSEAPPEMQSSYLVRLYKVRPAKLWKGLLESLKAEGHAPEVLDETAHIVKTSFVDFKQDDYPLQVGDPPPTLGGGYHIVQMIKIRAGKVSLEGVVTPSKQGSELKMRARILVTGVDRVNKVRVLVDRRSTGVIESDFIHKLEARLGLEHL